MFVRQRFLKLGFYMKFYSLEQTQAVEKQKMNQDYKESREIGIIRLGKEHLYFRRMRKIYYVPYADIPARLCCGRGNLEVENLVICTDKGEAAQIQLPGAKAGKLLLEELRKRLPDAAFTPEHAKSE